MPNPLLIGGLIAGGAYAAWRVARAQRRRLRHIAERFAIRRDGDAPDRPIPLERDPETGIYRPAGGDAAEREEVR